MIPHHEVAGGSNDPVLLLSSSLGTSLAMWEPQLPRLTERFRVVRYDQRGHGGSPAPSGPYTFAELGADALDLLDAVGCERVSFCGLSMGGMTGMWLAAHAPARIERLVLASTSAQLGPPELWTDRAAVVRERGTEAIAETALERWFTPAFRAREPETVERFRETLVAMSREGYAACCDAIRDWDIRDRLGSIAAPTLVLAGANDPATPPEHGELIAARVPNARLVVLPDAAHLANVEQADLFTDAVLEHLA